MNSVTPQKAFESLPLVQIMIDAESFGFKAEELLKLAFSAEKALGRRITDAEAKMIFATAETIRHQGLLLGAALRGDAYLLPRVGSPILQTFGTHEEILHDASSYEANRVTA